MFGDANVGNTGCPPMAPITRMNQLTPCLILLLKGKGGGGGGGRSGAGVAGG